MTPLDVEQVCSDCYRFWHGPPGRLSASGPYCENPLHALAAPLQTAPRVRDVHVDWLAEKDLAEARAHALVTQQTALARGVKHRRGYAVPDKQNLADRENAAIAEQAVALFVGEPWRKNETVHATADVGDDIDVKWRSRSDWDHIVDPVMASKYPDWAFVLARGVFPSMYLSGWAYGWEALEFDLDTFGVDRPPIHRCAAENLRFMDTLTSR